MTQPQNPNLNPLLARVEGNPAGADLIQIVEMGGSVIWRLNNFEAVWYAGSGAPGTVPGQLTNNLYLDYASGNVWLFNGSAWVEVSLAGGVESVNGLTGVIDLIAGTNMTITPSGASLTFASAGATGATGATGPLGPQFGSYLLYITSGTTYAQNLATGNVDYSGTDAAVVIRSVIGNMPAGGTISFNNGVYNLNSLVQENTGGFSQYYAIGIPGGGSTLYSTWRLIGESMTPAIDEFGGSTVQTYGVVFNLTTTAESSVAAGSEIHVFWARPDATHGIGATIIMKNCDVRIPSNQRGSETAINFSQALMADYEYVTADFNIAWNNIQFPVVGSHGLYGITTTASSKEQNSMKNTYAMGFNVGLDIQSEHTVLNNSYAINCNIGIQYGVRGGNIYHASSWLCCGWGECARGLLLGANCQEGSLLEISGLDIEDATASSFPAFQPVYHVYETTSGNSWGRISYTRVLAGVGLSVLATLFDGAGGGNFAPVTYGG